ncbi:hypothetical protein TI10_05415 [Photorhabdus luminescens subsp. luminescens]|nr:hypothetical protein TI10_05415 [Photorhabdus luminescens subsp. luminescens]
MAPMGNTQKFQDFASPYLLCSFFHPGKYGCKECTGSLSKNIQVETDRISFSVPHFLDSLRIGYWNYFDVKRKIIEYIATPIDNDDPITTIR